MNTNTIKVLLVEDNISDAVLIQQSLGQAQEDFFILEHVSRLSKAIDFLKNSKVDIIILDLALPESQGLETLLKLSKEITNIPIVVMSGLEDEKAAVEALNCGAEDYLVKGKVDDFRLITSLKFALQRANDKNIDKVSVA